HGADGLHLLGCRVLLVPALAVDRSGNRIGKGGGYYDRLLTALAAHPDTAPLLCAVVHDDELLDADPGIPVEPFDRPVAAALPPSAFRRLRPVPVREPLEPGLRRSCLRTPADAVAPRAAVGVEDQSVRRGHPPGPPRRADIALVRSKPAGRAWTLPAMCVP